MTSLILRTTTTLLVTLMFVFSLFLLVRGHNEPGGGFVGGLMAVGAFALYAVSYGVGAVRSALRFDPRTLMGAGLSLAALSGLIALLAGAPFLTGVWYDLHLGADFYFHLGSPILFDVGVYLVVIGATLGIILALEEEV
ncbi:MAG: Na+/H+ antiporter subunit B [Deinococcota bacterium]|nr:Na+/H+ antiporter subunit B [Deinococcota bacterium]